MNRTLKRVLGTAGAVVVGLAGAVTFASAAQAHHTNVTGAPECLPDGSWQVTWSVTDWNRGQLGAGWITEVISDSDAEITGDFTLDTTADDNVTLPYPGDEAPLSATQVLSGDVESVTLGIAAKWPNGKTFGPDDHRWVPAQVDKPSTGCESEPEPEEPVTGTNAVSDCFGIAVTVVNENPDALAEFTLTPSIGEPVTAEPAVGEPFTEYFFVQDIEAGMTVVVTSGDSELGVFEWDGLATCPEAVATATCEGLDIEITVPAEGAETTFTFTPEGGEAVELVIQPGTTETVSIPGEGESLNIVYEFSDGKYYETNTITWEKPECEEATTPVAEEKLPSTGSSMTIMISAAAALVAAAAVLFFIARRRRTAQDW